MLCGFADRKKVNKIGVGNVWLTKTKWLNKQKFSSKCHWIPFKTTNLRATKVGEPVDKSSDLVRSDISGWYLWQNWWALNWQKLTKVVRLTKVVDLNWQKSWAVTKVVEVTQVGATCVAVLACGWTRQPPSPSTPECAGAGHTLRSCATHPVLATSWPKLITLGVFGSCWTCCGRQFHSNAASRRRAVIPTTRNGCKLIDDD